MLTRLGQYPCIKQFWLCLVVLFSLRILIFFCACDFNCHLTLSNQNQIFLCTCCITLKHVMSLQGPISESLRRSNTAPFKKTSQQWRAVRNTTSFDWLEIRPPASETNALPLDQQAGHLTSFQLKLQLYYKWICNDCFLFFQITYSTNKLEINPRK